MNLEIFKNSGFELRGGLINGEPYFIARDICESLGLSNVSQALSRLDDDEKGITNIYTPGGNQNVSIINESGLYSLILTSTKQESKRFKKWVTSEVLPSIRKNGIYATAPTLENMINNPDFAIKLLTKLKQEQESKRLEQEKNKTLIAKIEQDKPLTDFGKAISSTNASIGVGSFAKIIEKSLNIKFGRNKCFEWLRENGFLISKKGSSHNQPYQKWINSGYFEVSEHLRQNSNYQQIDIVTLITGKGQEYLFNKIKEDLGKDDEQ